MSELPDDLRARMEESRRVAQEKRAAARAAKAAKAPQALILEHEPVEDIAEMAVTEEGWRDGVYKPELAPDPPDMTPFGQYVAALPEEVRSELSLDELREAFESAEREAKSERRKQLRADALAKAKDHARANSGLLTPAELEKKALSEKNNRMVRITPRMPFLSDTGGMVSEGITIDGTTYRHGETYTVPYGRALLIRDIIYRNQQAELEFEGKGRLHGLRQQRAEIFNEVRF